MYPLAGYYTDEAAFLKKVEEDAVSFKPAGQMVYSYTQPSPSSVAKGKGKSSADAPLDPESEDAIVFEVYHVRSSNSSSSLCAEHILGNMGDARFQRVPSPNAVVYPVVHRRWLVHKRGGGSVGVYGAVRIRGSLLWRISHEPLAYRYEKRKRRATPDVATYHFVGYSSLYPFYCFPERVRLRLR